MKTPHELYAHVQMHLLATHGEIQLLRNTTTTAAAAAAAAAAGVDAAVAKEVGKEKGGLERIEMLYRKRWDARNQEGVTFPKPGFALQPDDAFLVSLFSLSYLVFLPSPLPSLHAFDSASAMR